MYIDIRFRIKEYKRNYLCAKCFPNCTYCKALCFEYKAGEDISQIKPMHSYCTAYDMIKLAFMLN